MKVTSYLIFLLFILLHFQSIAQVQKEFYENPKYIIDNGIIEIESKHMGYVNRESTDSNHISNQSFFKFDKSGNLIEKVFSDSYSKKKNFHNITTYSYKDSLKYEENSKLYGGIEIRKYSYNVNGEIIKKNVGITNYNTGDTVFTFTNFLYKKLTDKTILKSITGSDTLMTEIEYKNNGRVYSVKKINKDATYFLHTYEYENNNLIKETVSGDDMFLLMLGGSYYEIYDYSKKGLVRSITRYQNNKPTTITYYTYKRNQNN